MAINIVISTIEDEDYDGNIVSIKTVYVEINGKNIGEYYSYPTTTSNEDIETEVESDLTTKGYSW